jgi:hypothetical protein
MKLSGRPEAPDQAQPQTLHGPLQRLLGVGLAEEAGIPVFLNQGKELFDGLNF